MLESQFEFKYKGGRDYIHGTDIFNQTLDWLRCSKGDVYDIDFAFHRLAVRQLKAVAGDQLEAVEPAATCSYTAGGVRQRFHLIETIETVTRRYPYPEDEIVKEMQVDPAKRQGVLASDVHYSDIEVLVAMTKALHHKVFPHLKGKWLFVRGRFSEPLPNVNVKKRAITIVTSFNEKLTRSEAVQDGVKVGEIFFSIV